MISAICVVSEKNQISFFVGEKMLDDHSFCNTSQASLMFQVCGGELTCNDHCSAPMFPLLLHGLAPESKRTTYLESTLEKKRSVQSLPNQAILSLK